MKHDSKKINNDLEKESKIEHTSVIKGGVEDQGFVGPKVPPPPPPPPPNANTTNIK